MECLKRFLAKPAEQLNDLNTVIPAIIDSNDVQAALKLVKSIIKAELIK